MKELFSSSQVRSRNYNKSHGNANNSSNSNNNDNNGNDIVDFFGPLNYRGFVEQPNEGEFWIHNSILIRRHAFTVHQLQTYSLAAIAGGLRLSTLRYKQPFSVREYLRLCEDYSDQRVLPRVRSYANMPLVMVTSWTTFDFLSLDFSAADRSLDQAKAKVTFVNPMIRNFRETIFPSAVILKSHDDGYWLRAVGSTSFWEQFSQMNECY
jgi:hypothetical protein